MPIEGAVRQRGLVDRRIVFADSERAASHVFPFVDRRWRVPFVVVNFSEGRPMVLDAPFRPDRFRFRTALRVRDLRRIESVPLQDFDELVHFDPWWVFRRVSGVDRAWVEAVFATNIAAPFRHGGRRYEVRDLAFSPELDRLEEITAKRALFRTFTFHPDEIELLALRATTRRDSGLQSGYTAKAL